jgi:hypothetical protein
MPDGEGIVTIPRHRSNAAHPQQRAAIRQRRLARRRREHAITPYFAVRLKVPLESY